MNVTVFSTTSCPYCKMVKDYLNQKGVAFVEKYVDQDESAREEMSRVSNGFLGVPFTVIDNGENKIETIVGFDKGKLDELVVRQ